MKKRLFLQCILEQTGAVLIKSTLFQGGLHKFDYNFCVVLFWNFLEIIDKLDHYNGNIFSLRSILWTAKTVLRGIMLQKFKNLKNIFENIVLNFYPSTAIFLV